MNGKPEVPVFALRTTVAGAILAELELIGAIELQGKRVRATGDAPETDFQHELEVIRGKSRPHCHFQKSPAHAPAEFRG